MRFYLILIVLFMTSFCTTKPKTSYILYAIYDLAPKNSLGQQRIERTKVYLYNTLTKKTEMLYFNGLLEKFSWHPSEKKVMFLYSEGTFLNSNKKKNIQIYNIDKRKKTKTNIYAIDCTWADKGKSIAYVKYLAPNKRFKDFNYLNLFNIKSKENKNILKSKSTIYEGVTLLNDMIFLDVVTVSSEPFLHSKWGILKLNSKSGIEENIIKINSEIDDVNISNSGENIIFSSIMDGDNGFYLMKTSNYKYKKISSGFGYGLDSKSHVGLSWSPCDNYISFVSSTENCFVCVFIMNISTGKYYKIYDFPVNGSENINPPYETAWSKLY